MVVGYHHFRKPPNVSFPKKKNGIEKNAKLLEQAHLHRLYQTTPLCGQALPLCAKTIDLPTKNLVGSSRGWKNGFIVVGFIVWKISMY